MRRRLHSGVALVVLTIATVTSGSAHAAPCTSTAATAQHIDTLEASIERGAHNSRAWALGWGVSLGLLGIGQLAIAPLTPRQERPEWWVGAGASAFGTLTRLVFRPRVLKERRLLSRDTSTGCERLAALQGAVVRSAQWERQGRSLLMHSLSLGFNAGVGLVLGLAFDRPVGGNRLAAIGGVVGEVMILTQPTIMSRTLHGVQSGQPSAAARISAFPFVTLGGGGLGLSGRM